MNKELLRKFWKQYKEYFQKPISEHKEKYKWKVLNQVFEKWDWNASDKPAMFKSAFEVSGDKNLWSSGNFYPTQHTLWMFDVFKDETIKVFDQLFDETIDLTERISKFIAFYDEKLPDLQALIPDKKINYHSHGDLRAIFLYLTLQYPEKYFLYKHSMFNAFNDCLELPRVKGGDVTNYKPFLIVCNEIKSFIIEDSTFLTTYNDFCNEDGNYNDQFQHLLVQDFIFSVGTYFNSSLNENTTMPKNQNVWNYSPAENARLWEEFYEQGIMAIGWDSLGDLSQYKDKKIIADRLREIYNVNGSKKNDSLANYEFKNSVAINDLIFVTKGKNEFVGYGVVTSDYYFDDSRDEYKSCRKVKWIKKGLWVDNDNETALKTLTGISKFPEYVAHLKKLLGIDTINKMNNFKMNFPLNQIFYGPPGTGKTHLTLQRSAEIIEDRIIEDYDEVQMIFNKNLGDQIEFITFHQNYSYEDFIQGLRPDIENAGNLTFERKDGVFKRISDRALKNLIDSKKPNEVKRKFEEVFYEFISPLSEGEQIEIPMKTVSYFITSVGSKSIEFRKNEGDSKHTLSLDSLHKMYDKGTNDIVLGGLQPYYNPLLEILLKNGKTNAVKVEEKRYVIVIDEINRANISRVFGELITLIEPDKRSHGSIPLKCTLPSGEDFIVPSNLYIIGTMNTADKSISLLDIALRRRFEFEAMYPKYKIEGHEIYDTEILEKINNRVKELKGHDFQIGHSYFMGNNIDLVERMNKKVIPLLLEYFMNDEKEVAGILKNAGLTIIENSYPLKINELSC